MNNTNNNYHYNYANQQNNEVFHATNGVYLREGEDFDSLLVRFKRSVKKSGVLEDYRKHEFFVKKSLKRKMNSKAHEQSLKD